jgi:hypothetical protein
VTDRDILVMDLEAQSGECLVLPPCFCLCLKIGDPKEGADNMGDNYDAFLDRELQKHHDAEREREMTDEERARRQAIAESRAEDAAHEILAALDGEEDR